MQLQKIPFYTFMKKKNKMHCFVLVGLQIDPDFQKIEKEFRIRHGVYNSSRIHNMGNITSTKYLTRVEVTLKIIGKVRRQSHRRQLTETKEQQIDKFNATISNNGNTLTSIISEKTNCLKCTEPHLNRNCVEGRVKTDTLSKQYSM